MATNIPVGKTILQLGTHSGAVDHENTYMEIHVEGEEESVKIPLDGITLEGKSAFEVAVAQGFKGTVEQWLESLEGKSAFEVAKANGFVGDEAAFIASLKGETGEPGEKGETGADGKSAFEIAQAGGFVGDEAAFIASLKGEKGEEGPEGPIGVEGPVGPAGQDGTVGPEGPVGADGQQGEQGIQGEPGNDGKSAFELAKENGYEGDPENVAEWVASLKGEKGDVGPAGKDGTNGVDGQQGIQGEQGIEGKSAYQVALDNGFDGSPEDPTTWLESLRGETGPEGPVAVLGEFMGVLTSVEDLGSPADFAQGDYYFIGTHVHMCVNGEWVDVGNFQGIPGIDGTGITVMGELASEALLPEDGGRNGDCWLIGKSMFVWNGTRWQEQGKEGAQGPEGPRGKEGPQGIQGIQGEQGDVGFTFVCDGTLETEAELPKPHVENHGYLVGTEATGFEFHVFTGGAWVNMGDRTGPQGPAGPDGQQGIQGEQGESGYSMRPMGVVDKIENLPETESMPGDTYNVDGHFHVWDGHQYVDMGDLTGLQGEQGIQGPTGEAGYINFLGTFEEMPEVGAHKQGDAFIFGENMFILSADRIWVDMGVVGQNGLNGSDGKSAFEAAKENGYVGDPNDEAAWVASLKGERGDKGADGLKGETGTAGKDGAEGPRGPEGPEGPVGPGLNYVGDFSGSTLPVGTKNDYASKDGRVHIHGGAAWIDVGAIGVQGEKGETGAAGKDGTNGIDGTNGVDGLKGDQGETGAAGKSAYATAVELGFVGDEAAWLATMKGEKGEAGTNGTDGTDGKDVLQMAIDAGLLSDGASMEDYMVLTTGPQGVEGEQGPVGATGSAIRIIGTKPTEGELPVTGEIGTGYAVPDPSAVGTFNCFIWVEPGEWFNLGHVVGATGEQGERGLRGVQGQRGEKGEKGDLGSVWIVFARDPEALDGRVGDYFFNSNTQEFFRKTGTVVWASLGHIGGGNLNAPSSDGKIKALRDGVWVDLDLIETVPTDEGVYQLVGGRWVKFDIYTLKAVELAVAAGKVTVDMNIARVFRILNTAVAAVTIANIPAADRATTIIVKVYGKVGAFNWTLAGGGTIRWFDGAAPSFTNDITTIVLSWDGKEMVGSVPN